MEYVSVNPFTEVLEKTYEGHSDAQMMEALASSHALYQSDWSRRSVASRLSILRRMASLLGERTDQYAAAIAAEMGKPLAQGRGEIMLCAGIAQYYADNAERFLATERIETGVGDAVVEIHPIGVLVAIEP